MITFNYFMQVQDFDGILACVQVEDLEKIAPQLLLDL